MFGRLRFVKRHILNMDIKQQSQYINKKLNTHPPCQKIVQAQQLHILNR